MNPKTLGSGGPDGKGGWIWNLQGVKLVVIIPDNDNAAQRQIESDVRHIYPRPGL